MENALDLYLKKKNSAFFFFLDNKPGLSVTAEQAKVVSYRGGNATLPCTFQRNPTLVPNPKLRIKWTKLTSDYLKEIDVFVAMGDHKKSYGSFHGRVHLQDTSENDASLVINELTLEDYGRYKCEVIDGLEDDTAVVTLNLQGNVVTNKKCPSLTMNNIYFLRKQKILYIYILKASVNTF